MTEERPKRDNPATDPPNRQNGQGEHHGTPHSPEDFDALNPAKPDSETQKRS